MPALQRNHRLRERDHGRDLAGGAITLNEFLDRWLTLAAQTEAPDENPSRLSQAMLERYLRPSLGARRQDRLTPLDLQVTIRSAILIAFAMTASVAGERSLRSRIWFPAINAATKQRKIQTEDRKTREYGALLLATGADPVKHTLEGATASQVFYLRSFEDSKAIVAKAKSAKQVVVVGASFIGLEVAASLRARGVSVHVVAPEQVPMEKILGERVGAFVRRLHESNGVVFHLGETVKRVDGDNATLTSGEMVEADFIVLGVGVRPSTALAEQAGLKLDRG